MGLWRTCWMVVVVVASCVRFTHALFGIPSFLEFGDCAQVILKDNFDPVKYTGLWFDIDAVPNEYQHTKKCVTQNYTWTGEEMDVATRGLSVEDEKVRQLAVMVKDEARHNPASMVVQADGVPEAPYQILATDYRTFSCVYSCLDGYAGFMAEFMWVFSRTPTLSTDKINYCYDLFTNLGVNPEKMVPVVQGEPCPYIDKLDQMLMESEKHVLKVMGPPAPATPSAIPPTLPSSLAQPEIQSNDVQEFTNDPKHDLKSGSRSHEPPRGSNTIHDPPSSTIHDTPRKGKTMVGVPPRGSSVREAERTDPSTSSTFIPATSLLFFLLTLILHLCFLGAVIVFTGLLSVGFLGRRLYYFHWLGIAFVLSGLVIVGLSDFMSSSNSNQDLYDPQVTCSSSWHRLSQQHRWSLRKNL